jgi:hypothetical protein
MGEGQSFDLSVAEDLAPALLSTSHRDLHTCNCGSILAGAVTLALDHLPVSLADLASLYGIVALSQKLPSTDSALSDPPGRSTVSALGGQAGRFFIPQNVEFAPHRTCWAMICRGQGRSLARLRWSIKSLRVRESGRGRIRGGDPTSTARQDALTS